MLQLRYPADLPITARRDEILAALRGNQVVIIAGETGSGKTTQLPKMCVEAGWAEKGIIGCTQPRRVAALSLSRRVAEETGTQWGREVGCKMRFSDDTSRETKLKFMTDGILLAEIQSDPLLRQYSAIIIDEAHERSLNIDFLLGYLRGLLQRRPELKLIVTSATIDTAAFSAAFGGAPIIEVSGRVFPVEVRYAPVESFARPGDEYEIDFVEAAARAAEDALIEFDDGDLLIFFPTERDIRDARDLIEGRLGRGFEVLTLFGRMASGDQQRIFSPGPQRRVILATNIAETSLTLPRIRAVIDTGLARLSRYTPRTRTKRLPVEPVSQSSASQRSGRAGRVRDGVAIRLYSAEDFEKRPLFTTPEIQRANLAEVILRMKSARLGHIEDFPFLNPPPANAIRAGYDLLHELGAIDDTQELTPLGRELARLPLDPTLGRMLLQARHEGCLPAMLVIAAGLSIPDPRERPEEKRAQADAAHKAFAAVDSDFLTLLKIWDAAPPPGRGATNALRRFCRTNFLSFTRLTEWRDLHAQLSDAMGDRASASAPVAPPGDQDAALHRSILSGLLAHLARKKERNLYVTSGNREVSVFPGSVVFERFDKKRAPTGGGHGKAPKEKSRKPEWVVAGEIVQTSQLFARTLAKIDPLWAAELGAHLCSYKYSAPHWSVKSGRVLATERTLLNGLELRVRRVDFHRIDPAVATDIFIKGYLLDQGGEDTDDESGIPNPHSENRNSPHPFIQGNLKLRDKLQTALSRHAGSRPVDLDQALGKFYATRLGQLSSVPDLNRLLRENPRDFLLATETALTGRAPVALDLSHFPDHLELGNALIPIQYNYAPGEAHDGVSLQVPLEIAANLTSGQLQWMIPGLREEQIGILLRALPKPIRRQLMPLEHKIKETAASFNPGLKEFLPALAAHLSRAYDVPIDATDWPPQSLPDYLQPRLEIIDKKRRVVADGRDFSAIQAVVEKTGTRPPAWNQAAARWDRPAVTAWSFGDLPETVLIEEIAGNAVLGYPGLALRDGEVDVRLFRTRDEALLATPPALRRLGELALARDLAWVQQDLRSFHAPSGKGGPAPAPAQKKQVATFASLGEALSSVPASLHTSAAPTATPLPAGSLQQTALQHITAHIFRQDPLFPLTAARFQTLCEEARRALPALVRKTRELAATILTTRQALLVSPRRYPGFEHDLDRLTPPDFLARTPHHQLVHLPRYLRAIEIRAERHHLHPARDTEKARPLADFADWPNRVPEASQEIFRWLLEEFRVQLFAQELGTAVPVSPKRLMALGNW